MDEVTKDGHIYVSVDSFLENLQKSEITLSLLLPGEEIVIIPRVYNCVYFMESESCFYLITASRYSDSIKLAKKIVINFLHLQLDYSRNIELVKENSGTVSQLLSKTYPNLSEIEVFKIRGLECMY